MGKFDFGVDSEAVNASLGEGFYTGDKPPKGVYAFNVKRVQMKRTKNDSNWGLNCIFEIQEPEGSDKAQYNGYAIFEWYNCTDSGAPFLNNFLDAIGADRKSFWSGAVTTINTDPLEVTKIGAKKIPGQIASAATKDGQDSNGSSVLKIAQWLAPGEGGSSDASDDSADAAGLDEESGGSTPASGGEDGSEPYTEEELSDLDKSDLQEILDEWGVSYAKSATKTTLVQAVLDAQSASDASEGGDTSDASGSDDETLTEEELDECSAADLKEMFTERGWDMPKPPVKSKLIKAFLAKQAEPPF